MPHALSRIASIAALVLVGGLLYLPSLATPQFEKEEARRAIPAREMLASGNYVLPTIWGRPYLNKPPLYFWAVAAASRITGGVDEASTRFPAVLSTIVTALFVYGFGSALFGTRAGLLAGAVFLVSLASFEKGVLGEIEAAFVCAVFGSSALLWSASRGSSGALLGSGLLLAAALLLKGPPALVFFLGAGLGIAAAGPGVGYLRSWRLWLPLGIGLGLAGVWVGLLLQQPGAEGFQRVWIAQLSRSSGASLAAYLHDRGRFVVSVLVALFPISLVCLAALGTPTWRRLQADARVRFIEIAVAAGLLFFLLAVGTRPRYAYPVVPMACLLAGVFLDAVLAERDDAVALERLRICGALVLGAGVIAAAAALASHVRPIGGIAGLDAWGWGLMGATLIVCVTGLRRVAGGSRQPVVVHAFLVIALLRLLQLTQLVPQLAGERPLVARVAEFQQALPADARLRVHVSAQFNALFYLRPPLDWIARPEEARPGDLLLVDAAARERFAAAAGVEELLTTPLYKGREVTLLRVGKPASVGGL
jgi:4-amino-4-deoxy-L-arabinose transferase-like glycosyltransferase